MELSQVLLRKERVLHRRWSEPPLAAPREGRTDPTTPQCFPIQTSLKPGEAGKGLGHGASTELAA